MRVIIAGSRGITEYGIVALAIALSGFEITEVVSGNARGVDRLGELWAALNGVAVRRFPAEWDQYGKKAGALRNIQMAGNADGLVAVWDGRSRGTDHMIQHARATGLKVYVHKLP